MKDTMADMVTETGEKSAAAAESTALTCDICAHACRIPEGKRGLCQVREHINGRIRSLTHERRNGRSHGRLIAVHVDPVEKKPLYHFLPGTPTLSIASAGCNFRCRFCQNADIAQMPADTGKITGEMVDAQALVNAALSHGCHSISHTYTEPSVHLEFGRDCAMLAREKGLKTIFVTNGFMSPSTAADASCWLDAANVDLKAWSDAFYRKICGARLAPVLDTLRRLAGAGVWVEVTTLLIPGLNDDPEELAGLAGFIATELGSHIPWHISRFHPAYRMTDRPVTPRDVLLMARDIGISAGLKYVYIGNAPDTGSADTRCPGCGAVILSRSRYRTRTAALEMNGNQARCAVCQEVIHGQWQRPR